MILPGYRYHMGTAADRVVTGLVFVMAAVLQLSRSARRADQHGLQPVAEHSPVVALLRGASSNRR